jgi:hypothetical protein
MSLVLIYKRWESFSILCKFVTDTSVSPYKIQISNQKCNDYPEKTCNQMQQLKYVLLVQKNQVSEQFMTDV